MRISTSFIALAVLASEASAAYSKIAENWTGESLLNGFNFFTNPDPTHGHVKYVNANIAKQKGYTVATKDNLYIGVNHKDISPNGRESVRIESKKSYTRGLFVLDVTHMPGEICGTWPAFWTVGPDWPKNGEIDIVEGANNQKRNDMTLHTGPGCTTSNTVFTGKAKTKNCDVKAPNQGANVGCQIEDQRDASYGHTFNQQGGGVYAMEWNSNFIKIWFFPRKQIPADALSLKPEPAKWGRPAATFAGGCDINKHFKAHKIVFDTTFCGDWAGNTWQSSGCAAQTKTATCNAFVANNPAKFKDAFWRIKSLKVFSY